MSFVNQISELRQRLRETIDDLYTPWRDLPDLSTAIDVSEAAKKTSYAQFRTLLRESSSNVAATAIGIGLMTIALWLMSRSPAAWAWGIAIMLCLFWGPLINRFYDRPRSVEDVPDTALRDIEIALGRSVSSIGVLWGLIGFVVPVAARDYAPYLAVGLLMICAGSVSLLLRHRPGIAWIAVPCALLGSASMILTGQLLNVFIGVGLLVLVGLLVRLARMQNSLLTQTMLAVEERQVLLSELDARRKDADRANAAKTRFLAAVSHDLRQPMHSVALLATALRQSATADVDLIEQIDASVHSMDDLLCALLDVSKLDTGAVPLQVGTFALAPFLQRVHKQFEAQARDKKVDLRVQASDVHVVSDASQLQRVLANLLANAIRYTPPHGRVMVRCRLRGKALWIQVWDSGIGIARAHRKQIFEEFFQIERSRQRSQDGIGLGLSIAQRVARLLGHAIELRSRPGRGSVFSICVPLGQASPQQDASRARLHARLRHQLVLVIDDDRTIRDSVLALFTSLQCHVLLADSTATALHVTSESLRTPDLIVSDYRLGADDTGIDAIAAVRTATAEQIPAVLMTAEFSSEPHAAAKAIDVAVLSKPLQLHALAREVERMPLSAI